MFELNPLTESVEQPLYDFDYHKECTQLQFVLETAAKGVTKTNIGEKLKGVLNFVKEKMSKAWTAIVNFFKKIFKIGKKNNDSSMFTSDELNEVRSGTASVSSLIDSKDDDTSSTSAKSEDKPSPENPKITELRNKQKQLMKELDSAEKELQKLPITYQISSTNIIFKFVKGRSKEKVDLVYGFTILQNPGMFDNLWNDLDKKGQNSPNSTDSTVIARFATDLRMYMSRTEQRLKNAPDIKIPFTFNKNISGISKCIDIMNQGLERANSTEYKERSETQKTIKEINTFVAELTKYQKGLVETMRVLQVIMSIEVKFEQLENIAEELNKLK